MRLLRHHRFPPIRINPMNVLLVNRTQLTPVSALEIIVRALICRCFRTISASLLGFFALCDLVEILEGFGTMRAACPFGVGVALSDDGF